MHCWFYVVADKEDVEDDDFESGDGAKKEARRNRRGQGAERDRPLPPLLARVNGQIEVHVCQHMNSVCVLVRIVGVLTRLVPYCNGWVVCECSPLSCIQWEEETR